MKKSELKALIKEVVQEMARKNTSQFEVEIYLPKATEPEAIISTSAKNPAHAIELTQEFLYSNSGMKMDHPNLFNNGVLRQDLKFKPVKTA